MKKYILKIIICILIVLILVLSNSYTVFGRIDATTIDPGGTSNPVDTIIDVDAYDPSQDTDDSSGRAGKKVSNIFSVIQVIGIITSVITIMIIGIRYMIGSVQERAEYKKTMIPWIIGAILIFSATSLPKFILNFAEIFNN